MKPGAYQPQDLSATPVHFVIGTISLVLFREVSLCSWVETETMEPGWKAANLQIGEMVRDKNKLPTIPPIKV